MTRFKFSTLFLLVLITSLSTVSLAQEKPTLVVSKGHHQSINCVDISPDGKTIVSGADDNLVKVYDLYMKQELNTFTEHTNSINKVQFSPDGKYIVSTSSFQILIHSHPEGRLIQELPIKSMTGIYSVHVTTDNELYVGYNEGIYVFDIVTGEHMRVLDMAAKNFVILSDDKTIVSTHYTGSERCVGFFTNDGEIIDSVMIEKMVLDRYAISSNGKKIALEISPGKVGVIDVKTRSLDRIFEAGPSVNYFIGLNKNGSQLITCGFTNELIFWDVRSGEKLKVVKDLSPDEAPGSMSMAIKDMAISDNDDLVAFCYSDIIAGRQNYTVEWFNYKDLSSQGKHAGGVKMALSISVDHTGTILSTGTVGNSMGVKCLDLTKGSQKAFIPGTAYLGAGGKYLAAINSSDNSKPKLEVYQMPQVKRVKSYDLYGFANVKMSFSGRLVGAIDQKYIGVDVDDPMAPQVEPYIRVWNVETDEMLVNIKRTLMNNPLSLLFSKDDKYLYLIYSTKIETIEISTSKLIRTSGEKVNLDYNNPVTPDGKYIMSSDLNKVQGVDIETGDVVDFIHLDKMIFPITSSFSPDQKLIGVSVLKAGEANPYRVQIFNWETKTFICELIGHHDIVRQIAFDRENKHAFSADANGVILMWDLAECKAKATFLAFGAEDYLIQSPEGYYKSSKGNIASIGFRQNGALYTFDQFDLRYNRPDKVLAALGMATEKQVEMYHRAYQKRMSRMGFKGTVETTTNLHAPQIEILNAKQIPLKTTSNQILVKVKAEDELLPLDRLNVVANGVPIYGRLGKNLKTENLLTYEEDLKIPLVQEKNQIQISVMNTDGTESLRRSFSIQCEKKLSKPNLHVIALGVQSYEDSTMNLTYSDKDAKDFIAVFDKNANSSNLFSNVYTTVLTNEQVTAENVSRLRESLMKTKVDDQVILYYSGHGLLSEDFDYFLSTYDVDFYNPIDKGLPFDDFKGLVDAVPARNRLILMDACHSGEVDKDEIAFVPAEKVEDKTLVTKSFNSKGFKTIGLGNSFELMKELFVELRKESGATIIASSAGKEYSLESDEWKNGVFTFALKEGLLGHKADVNDDQIVSVSELKSFLFMRVKELTNGEQTPTVRRENLQHDCLIY